MSTLDLNNLPEDQQVTLSKKETDGERRIRLGKDIAVFGFALTVLALAVIWSGWVLITANASADDKRTAQTIIIAIVSGLLGYLLKK